VMHTGDAIAVFQFVTIGKDGRHVRDDDPATGEDGSILLVRRTVRTPWYTKDPLGRPNRRQGAGVRSAPSGSAVSACSGGATSTFESKRVCRHAHRKCRRGRLYSMI
jgi:hypothetical protein